MDSLGIEVHFSDAGDLALTAGNPLGDALMRAGRVVVRLVLGQDGFTWAAGVRTASGGMRQDPPYLRPEPTRDP